MNNNRLASSIIILIILVSGILVLWILRGLADQPEPAGPLNPTYTPASAPLPELAITSTRVPLPPDLPFPIRAAFYFPSYPQDWQQEGINPFSHYQPSLGYYSLDDKAIISRQIAAMQYGKIQVGIAMWGGPKHPSNDRIQNLLAEAEKTGFRWSLYLQSENTGNPPADAILAELEYIREHYASSPAYLHINGRFVVFIQADRSDNCEMTDRWTQANTVGAYLVQKVFSGYKACLNQPDAWHQYSPDQPQRPVGNNSYSISPGFWKADAGGPALARNLERWNEDVRAMTASTARFQLISTFNGWADGTAIESAKEWESASGFGQYLDALHNTDGAVFTPTPTDRVKKQPTSELPLPGTLVPKITTEPVIPPPVDGPPQSGTEAITLVGAGDISICDSFRTESTAEMVEQFPAAAVFTAGDNVQDVGALDEFTGCFEKTWGRFKARIHPAAGNHDYMTAGGANYYSYFGAAAGEAGKGYYSYDLGTWHVLVLNSNCDDVGGCNKGSPQELWLLNDLANHPNKCTLAIWHHPRFSSGEHGNQERIQPFWEDIYAAGVELVVSGHDHDYERFAPLDANGKPDPQAGIRQFVVGTGGGGGFRDVSDPPEANSLVTLVNTSGIIKFDLLPDGYQWSFLHATGATPLDSGSAQCH
ncbi:MAG TPA: metallophosphoesterase [Anaerolineales bacterium]